MWHPVGRFWCPSSHGLKILTQTNWSNEATRNPRLSIHDEYNESYSNMKNRTLNIRPTALTGNEPSCRIGWLSRLDPMAWKALIAFAPGKLWAWARYQYWSIWTALMDGIEHSMTCQLPGLTHMMLWLRNGWRLHMTKSLQNGILTTTESFRSSIGWTSSNQR